MLNNQLAWKSVYSILSLDSFTKEISEDIKTVQEGATLRLEVKRERGAFRDVHVIWRLTGSTGIDNASSQISPINGSLTFKQVYNCELVRMLRCGTYKTMPCLSWNAVVAGKAPERSEFNGSPFPFCHPTLPEHFKIFDTNRWMSGARWRTVLSFAEVLRLYRSSRPLTWVSPGRLSKASFF